MYTIQQEILKTYYNKKCTDENVAEKFKNDLGNIVRIHELIKDLEDGSWELYLSNRHHCRFEKKT